MNRDIAAKLSLELKNADILNLCLSSKLFNYYICENESFWFQKIRKDFPFIQKPKEYGSTYKESYSMLISKVPILIDIDIRSYNEDGEEESTEINIRGEFEFPRFRIKEILGEALPDFFQAMRLYGEYTVKIDEDCVCYESNYLSHCFDDVKDDVEEISITLDAHEIINVENESKYQEYLEKIIKKYIDLRDDLF